MSNTGSVAHVTQTPKERYGLNVRPLPLATQQAFRRQAAARGMTQATYFIALMEFAEYCRPVFAGESDHRTLTGIAADVAVEFERLGLARVVA